MYSNFVPNMDLVAAYDSDDGKDSDIEEIKVSASKKKRTKSIDIIDLESDCETGSAAKKRKTESSKENIKKTNSSTEQIDCIELTESDGDNPSKSATQGDSPSKSTTQKSITDSLSKKTDYLHLESSDSDTEFQSADDKVKDLANSASILSDIPFGPVKPSDVSNNSIAGNKYVDKQYEGFLHTSDGSVDVNSASNRSTPNSNQCFNMLPPDASCPKQDYSKFKTGFTFDTNKAESNENKCEKEEKVSHLYEENERVIEASKKNVVCRIPRQIVQTHIAHSNIIMALNWCIPQYSHLFLSASLDCSVKIWDLYRQNPVQRVVFSAGINAAQWSLDGGQIVAGGNEKKAFIFDVQTGKGNC